MRKKIVEAYHRLLVWLVVSAVKVLRRARPGIILAEHKEGFDRNGATVHFIYTFEGHPLAQYIGDLNWKDLESLVVTRNVLDILLWHGPKLDPRTGSGLAEDYEQAVKAHSVAQLNEKYGTKLKVDDGPIGMNPAMEALHKNPRSIEPGVRDLGDLGQQRRSRSSYHYPGPDELRALDPRNVTGPGDEATEDGIIRAIKEVHRGEQYDVSTTKYEGQETPPNLSFSQTDTEGAVSHNWPTTHEKAQAREEKDDEQKSN